MYTHKLWSRFLFFRSWQPTLRLGYISGTLVGENSEITWVTWCVRKLWVIHSKKITVYKFICNFLSLAHLRGWLALSRKNKTFQGIIKHLGVLSQTQFLFHCHWEREREERGNLCQQIPVKRKMPRGNKIQILQFRKTQAISSRQLSQREECEELYINVTYE